VKLLAAVLASAAALVPLAGATTLEPTRVQVVAMEFYYNLSRRTVTAGPAIVQLVDFGQDPHDLRMERVGGTRIYGTPIIQPGTLYNLKLDLLPGTYELWCSVANHRALGMEARLVVRPAPG
jgi:plastocyanin